MRAGEGSEMPRTELASEFMGCAQSGFVSALWKQAGETTLRCCGMWLVRATAGCKRLESTGRILGFDIRFWAMILGTSTGNV